VTVDIGDVAVIVSRPSVIVCPSMVHVPFNMPMSVLGKMRSQPLVGVNTELGSVE